MPTPDAAAFSPSDASAEPPAGPGGQRRLRLALWGIVAIALIIGDLAWLWLLRGRRIFTNDTILIGGPVALVPMAAAMLALIRTTPPGAIRLRRQTSARLILLVSFALQAAAVCLLWPALSDEVVRYRSDGGMWLHGKSPYVTAPAELQQPSTMGSDVDAGSWPDSVDRLVPFATMRTIYPPLAEAIFLGCRAVEEAAFGSPPAVTYPSPVRSPAEHSQKKGSDPFILKHLESAGYGTLPYHGSANETKGSNETNETNETKGSDPLILNHFEEYSYGALSSHDSAGDASLWRRAMPSLRQRNRGLILRATSAGCAVAAVALLLRLLRLTDRSPWLAVLFAWNPLLLLECGGMGHVDIVGITLLLGALSAAYRMRFARAVALIVLAAAVKPWAIGLLPLLLRQAWKTSGVPKAGQSAAVAVVVFAAVFVPPMMQPGAFAGWRNQARIYARQREANGSAFEFFNMVVGHRDADGNGNLANPRARIITALIVSAAVVAVTVSDVTPAAGAYWLFMITLLASPVAYPWHTLWALCLVPALERPGGWTMLVWSATACVSYQLWRTTNWTLPWTSLLIEYAPVYLTLVLEGLFSWRGNRGERPTPKSRPIIRQSTWAAK